MGIKTIEEARELPEIYWTLAFTAPFTPDGGMEGSELVLFTDIDGRIMEIVETPDGPAKIPFRV